MKDMPLLHRVIQWPSNPITPFKLMLLFLSQGEIFLPWPLSRCLRESISAEMAVTHPQKSRSKRTWLWEPGSAAHPGNQPRSSPVPDLSTHTPHTVLVASVTHCPTRRWISNLKTRTYSTDMEDAGLGRTKAHKALPRSSGFQLGP